MGADTRDSRSGMSGQRHLMTDRWIEYNTKTLLLHISEQPRSQYGLCSKVVSGRCDIPSTTQGADPVSLQGADDATTPLTQQEKLLRPASAPEVTHPPPPHWLHSTGQLRPTCAKTTKCKGVAVELNVHRTERRASISNVSSAVYYGLLFHVRLSASIFTKFVNSLYRIPR